MKKSVLVEYVGVDDVMEIFRLANSVGERGHYVCVEFSLNFGNNVKVAVDIGGFRSGENYSFVENFSFGDNKADVEAMNKAKDYLIMLKKSAEGKVPS